MAYLLLDALNGNAFGLDLDAQRIAQNLVGELGDFLRHGRRKQKRLALIRQHAYNGAKVPDESEVEHVVCLVENEVVDHRQVAMAITDEIEQTARRCDNDIGATAQCIDLGALADAADNDCLPDTHVLAIGTNAVVDLDNEFARRRENECTRHFRRRLAAIALAVVAAQKVQQRQNEGRRLSGTCLSKTEHVAALDECRNGLRLDRRRRRVTGLMERTKNCLGKPKAVECSDSHKQKIPGCRPRSFCGGPGAMS